jgi:hypothetical protein
LDAKNQLKTYSANSDRTYNLLLLLPFTFYMVKTASTVLTFLLFDVVIWREYLICFDGQSFNIHMLALGKPTIQQVSLVSFSRLNKVLLTGKKAAIK